MAAITKILNISKTLNNVVKTLVNLSLKTEKAPFTVPASNRISLTRYCFVHSTSTRNDTSNLMEFFEDETNWGKTKIKAARSWKLDELRIKSNEDLHKLWYILLKEKNMLLTMEEIYKKKYEPLPNPERLDKVEISMENIETVVRERNKSYHMLETGESGERPAQVVRNAIGLPFVYRYTQHSIPKFMNTKWKKTHVHKFNGRAVNKFLSLYHEKFTIMRRREKGKRRNAVLQILRQFPNVDMESIKEKYPDVDIEKIKRMKKCRGHFIPSWW